MATISSDVIVIGGGIAGVSIAAELAAQASVILLESESTLAFHTTGRSAATWLGTYGNETVRALTAASREFLAHPPAGMFVAPLAKPLGLLYVAGTGQLGDLHDLYANVLPLTPDAQFLSIEETLECNPILKADAIEGGMIEPGALDIDVTELHAGYLRRLKGFGGAVVTRARVSAATRSGDGWQVTTEDGKTYEATNVVNAAGAWVDEVAAVFGAAPIGIRPLRRTMFAAPAGSADLASIPMTFAVDHSFYLRPEGGQLLCSPQDETLMPPGDVKPDELEIARAIDAINEVTTLGIRHVRSPWAGLRNFAPDETPVVGYAPETEGFFWFAGQGGYGIQMAPALARLGSALFMNSAVPADIAARVPDPACLAPAREGADAA